MKHLFALILVVAIFVISISSASAQEDCVVPTIQEMIAELAPDSHEEQFVGFNLTTIDVLGCGFGETTVYDTDSDTYSRVLAVQFGTWEFFIIPQGIEVWLGGVQTPTGYELFYSYEGLRFGKVAANLDGTSTYTWVSVEELPSNVHNLSACLTNEQLLSVQWGFMGTGYFETFDNTCTGFVATHTDDGYIGRLVYDGRILEFPFRFSEMPSVHSATGGNYTFVFVVESTGEYIEITYTITQDGDSISVQDLCPDLTPRVYGEEC
jgi:hypothetical protein